MKKLLLIALLTGVVGLTGSYQNVQAQDFGPPDDSGFEQRGPGGHGGEHFGSGGGMHKKGMRGQQGGKEGFMKMMKDLNLTEEQKAQLKAEKDSTRDKMKALGEQMRTERKKFMDLMSNTNISKQELMAQQKKISALQDQMAALRIDGMIAFREVLTPDQLTQFQKKISEHHSKMEEKMQQRRSMMQQRRQNGNYKKQNN